METKQYQYKSAINIDLIKQHFNSFKTDLIPKGFSSKKTNVKYILLSVNLSKDDAKADLCKNVKVNLTTKCIQVLATINKNVKILSKHFGNEEFEEILFQYKILTYSEFISINNNKKQLKSLITSIKPAKKRHR